MAYFSQDFIDFFIELSANNHKEWFHANKKRYERDVKEPFYAYLRDVIEAFKKYEAEMDLEVKNAVFRINRDIRFSKDKSPYKNHVAAIINKDGRKNMEYPGLYIHLEVGNVMFAGGSYMLSKENLLKLRRAIVDDPDAAEKALKDKKFNSMYAGLSEGEKNKILPKEFKGIDNVSDLVYNKQYYYHKTYEEENTLLRDDFLEFTMEHYENGKSWNDYLIKNVFS